MIIEQKKEKKSNLQDAYTFSAHNLLKSEIFFTWLSMKLWPPNPGFTDIINTRSTTAKCRASALWILADMWKPNDFNILMAHRRICFFLTFYMPKLSTYYITSHYEPIFFAPINYKSLLLNTINNKKDLVQWLHRQAGKREGFILG